MVQHADKNTMTFQKTSDTNNSHTGCRFGQHYNGFGHDNIGEIYANFSI